MPIPGSPAQTTSRPAPSRAAPTQARNASSSRCRPTMRSPVAYAGARVGVPMNGASPCVNRSGGARPVELDGPRVVGRRPRMASPGSGTSQLRCWASSALENGVQHRWLVHHQAHLAVSAARALVDAEIAAATAVTVISSAAPVSAELSPGWPQVGCSWIQMETPAGRGARRWRRRCRPGDRCASRASRAHGHEAEGLPGCHAVDGLCTCACTDQVPATGPCARPALSSRFWPQHGGSYPQCRWRPPRGGDLVCVPDPGVGPDSQFSGQLERGRHDDAYRRMTVLFVLAPAALAMAAPSPSPSPRNTPRPRARMCWRTTCR